MKSYIATKQINVPIIETGGHRGAKVRSHIIRKGAIFQGELKHANNKPAFILVGKTGVVPIDSVQEVSAKPIGSEETSSAIGDSEQVKQADQKNKSIISSNPKIKYGDAFIIGALVGFVGVHLAQKHNYLPAEDKKLKLYGALGCSLLGMYIVYRITNNSDKKVVKLIKKD